MQPLKNSKKTHCHVEGHFVTCETLEPLRVLDFSQNVWRNEGNIVYLQREISHFRCLIFPEGCSISVFSNTKKEIEHISGKIGQQVLEIFDQFCTQKSKKGTAWRYKILIQGAVQTPYD